MCEQDSFVCEVFFGLAFVNLADLNVGEGQVVKEPACYNESALASVPSYIE
jgi:hypothetical protein